MVQTEGAATWPVLDMTGDESRPVVCRKPCFSLHFPNCVWAINHYQVLISSNDFVRKNNYINIRFACEFKICRRKAEENGNISFLSLLYFNFHQIC